MRKLEALIAAAAAFGLIAPASAADIPLKARPMAPVPPAYNWTGFYIGGNVGYGWGHANTDFNADPVVVNTTAPGSFSVPGFKGSESAKLSGAIGGGQFGYNWQFSPHWVFGVEADIQASGIKGSNNSSNPFNFTVPPFAGGGPVPVIGTAVSDYEAKISWFGTVRGRIGYAWNRTLVYATGGLAYGRVELDGTHTVSGTWGGFPFSTAHAIGHSQLNLGWTAGAGIEGALAGNWTWKTEYLYVDLGSLNDSDVPAILITTVTGGQTFTHTHFTDNIVRLGANYKF